jgi:Reverse transcriptase (RNA-dependent DNA polymerase)
MTLKQDLIRIGYLPENVPPSLYTDDIANFFDGLARKYISWDSPATRGANYNTSKRGLSRRTFSIIHPITAHDIAEFIDSRNKELTEFIEKSPFSMSKPRLSSDGERAIQIASHSELEQKCFDELSGYRFIAKTDISRFYHSIYTHSVPWAVHGKAEAKQDRNRDSEAIFCNVLDYILRQGQDGQTVGIPVGPDASRYVAELVSTAIDLEFQRRCDLPEITVVRHVDDIWIGAQSHMDAEQALWRYREAMREFELDINDSKTRIFSEGFTFADTWPSEISKRIEFALESPSGRRTDRLRAALEFAFSQSVIEGDDGILKYAIRQLDDAEADWAWPTIQSFLMRCSVQFGHTIDYVVRVIVWRYFAKGDLHVNRWGTLLKSILNRHGRIGNDSEVCWCLFAALKLGISIPDDIAKNIITNCGPMCLVSLLNCVEKDLVSRSMFEAALEICEQDNGNGAMWPLSLEWASRRWPKHQTVSDSLVNEVVKAMGTGGVKVFDHERLTRVFDGVEESARTEVSGAIEHRISLYEDTNEDKANSDIEF